jgi:alkylated DNA repair dioxygenase AlkB
MPERARTWLDPESWVDWWEDFLDEEKAAEVLAWSLSEVHWEERGDSRLLAWYGAFDYQYPGVSHPAQPVPGPLVEMCEKVRSAYREEASLGFDGIRLNRYDSAHSFVDFHSDDEPSLAPEYPIAFLSLGRPRTLLFRATSHTVHPGYAFTLGHASLLVMGGQTQSHWYHGVPVEPQRDETRVSLTMRKGSHDLTARRSAVEGQGTREEN